MSVLHPRRFTALDYDRAAEEYLRSLPLEHFMEATPQATQREITVESLALLRIRRPDMQYFNELLVQYLFQGGLGQVVPDNMVILSTQLSQARTNYAVELEPARPFLVMEYVSPRSERKDYEESFRKYEQELKVPYCLLFHPENQDLRVYHHDGEHYVRLEPDLNGRCLITDLDLQVGLHQQWVRFWHQGQLLELPSELQQRLDEQARQIAAQSQQIVAQSQQMAAQSQQIVAQSQQIVAQSQQIAAQSQQIGQLQDGMQGMRDRLRHHVEKRALKAGRRDILERLPDTTDLDQLDEWLVELE
jgi:Uma2 family endonuclease